MRRRGNRKVREVRRRGRSSRGRIMNGVKRRKKTDYMVTLESPLRRGKLLESLIPKPEYKVQSDE